MKVICLTSNEYVNCIEPFAYFWQKAGGMGYRRHGCWIMTVRPAASAGKLLYSAQSARRTEFMWAGGLLHLLEQLKDEYILLLLEDYFMCSVRWDRLWELELLDAARASVGKIDLSGDRLKVDHTVSVKT